ncbi:MAG: hypothetical protein ABFS46_02230 [Myxococcota bacterium]
MEIGELIYVLLVYVFHGAIALAQAGLACFLLATGFGALLGQKPDAPRGWGALRVVLGLMLVAPLAVGAPVAISIVAAVLAFGVLVSFERRAPATITRSGRLVRRSAVAFAGIAALFMLWEREDNLALGADLLLNTIEFRDEELAWQQSNDPRSPKVGDLAPDFELQDPTGKVQVRLSDFRGKRPVALVFGSYT